MSQTIYHEIKIISEKLRAAGEDRWSANLDEALAYVGLGSEILGEIKLQLQNLKNSDIPHQLGMEKHIDDVLDRLNKLLRLP